MTRSVSKSDILEALEKLSDRIRVLEEADHMGHRIEEIKMLVAAQGDDKPAAKIKSTLVDN